jgi:hypothetical protein
MSSEQIYDYEALDLLAIVEAWYLEHGAEEIPEHPESTHHELTNEQKRLFPLLFESNFGYCFKYGGSQVINVPGRLIQFFVGVKLGLPETVLFRAMGHHDVHLEDIMSPEYGQTDDGYPVVLVTADKESINETEFNIKLFQTFGRLNSRHEAFDSFDSTSTRYALAVMHTDVEHKWPRTIIENQSKISLNSGKQTIALPSDDFGFIQSRLEKMSHLPNSNMMDYLKRSGMLTESVIKKDTVLYTMWEELLGQCVKGKQVPEALLEFAIRHPNPATRAVVKKALLSVGEDPQEFLPPLGNLIPYLQKKLTDEFADVLDSPIFMLNIIPTHDPESMLADIRHISHYRKLLVNPELILSKVAQELLSLPFSDLGFSQLNVLGKMCLFDFPVQRIEGFSPETLVNHLLDGLKVYCCQSPIAGQSHKPGLDRDVQNGLKSLVQMVMLSHKFDCNQFSDRTLAEKRLLIDGGIDVKEMKSILSLPQLGEIFSQDLNL